MARRPVRFHSPGSPSVTPFKPHYQPKTHGFKFFVKIPPKLCGVTCDLSLIRISIETGAFTSASSRDLRPPVSYPDPDPDLVLTRPWFGTGGYGSISFSFMVGDLGYLQEQTLLPAMAGTCSGVVASLLAVGVLTKTGQWPGNAMGCYVSTNAHAHFWSLTKAPNSQFQHTSFSVAGCLYGVPRVRAGLHLLPGVLRPLPRRDYAGGGLRVHGAVVQHDRILARLARGPGEGRGNDGCDGQHRGDLWSVFNERILISF